MTVTVDTRELEEKVKRMYRAVATEPSGEYHFELGRQLAARLGYPAEILDAIPDGAIESFAGVGYFFDLADLREGETVVDLGSGSGMDVFFAAVQVGAAGGSSASTSPRSSWQRPARSPPRVVSTWSSSAKDASSKSPLTTRAPTASSPTASSTSRPKSSGCSPRRHACCDPADASRSPTSSASAN